MEAELGGGEEERTDGRTDGRTDDKANTVPPPSAPPLRPPNYVIGLIVRQRHMAVGARAGGGGRILIILHLVLGNIRFVVRAAAVMGRMPKYVSHVRGQNLLTSSMLCDVREIQGFYFVLCFIHAVFGPRSC